MIITREQFTNAYKNRFLFKDGQAAKPAEASDYDVTAKLTEEKDERGEQIYNPDGSKKMKSIVVETLKIDPKTKRPIYDEFPLRQVGCARYGATQTHNTASYPQAQAQVQTLDAPHLFVVDLGWTEGRAEAWGR